MRELAEAEEFAVKIVYGLVIKLCSTRSVCLETIICFRVSARPCVCVRVCVVFSIGETLGALEDGRKFTF